MHLNAKCIEEDACMHITIEYRFGDLSLQRAMAPV
jgi:hypothetical protein